MSGGGAVELRCKLMKESGGEDRRAREMGIVGRCGGRRDDKVVARERLKAGWHGGGAQAKENDGGSKFREERI